MTEKNDTQINLKLQQTVRFFETLLRASADGIIITDPANNIIFVNDTFCTFFSGKRQDVLETNLFIWLEKLDHNAKDIWKGLEDQINEHGIAKDVEFSMKSGNGRRYYSVNSSLLEKIDIEDTGLIISIWRDDTERKMAKEALQHAHDRLEMRVKERTAQLTDINIELKREITERKQAEKTLQAERDNLVRIFEAMIDGVYIVDQKYDIRYVNPVLEKDFGQLKGRKCYEYFHDRTEVCPWCKNDEVFAGKTVRWEWYSSKNEKTYDLIDTPLLNPDGTIYKLEIFRDITERKQAEKDMEEAIIKVQNEKNKSESIISALGDAISIQDTDFKVLYQNKIHQEIVGDQKGRYCYREYEHREKICDGCPVNRSFKDGKIHTEERCIIKDGQRLYFDIKSSPLRDSTGKIIAGIEIGRDITERKQAEEALRENEEKFKYIFDHSVIGKSLTLPSGELNVNRAFCEMLGYSAQELKNRKWQEITHPDDVELTSNCINSMMSGEKQSVRFIKRYIHKNGNIIWTDLSTGLRRDKDGKPLYLITAIIDITERKRMEEALYASEEKFAKAFYSNPGGLTITDLNDGRMIEMNDSFANLFGYSREESIGHTTMELGLWITPEDRVRFTNNIKKDGFIRNAELELRKRCEKARCSIIPSCKLLWMASGL